MIESQKSKHKILRSIKYILVGILVIVAFQFFKPTWTTNIIGERSINELRKLKVNGIELETMIRGYDKDNPIIIFVHGGPCCSEIPYARKYQDLLEKDFTVVNYDQRGSGKSYEFGKDYSNVNANTHVGDLIELTKNIEQYLGQDKVILIGHSYGTYLATRAVSQEPELYRAYVGIGQVSNMVEGELDSLDKCVEAAKLKEDKEDYEYLESIRKNIENGDMITPREYIRKYNFAARNIDENGDYFKGFLFGPEYNWVDALRFYSASSKYQQVLIKEVVDKSITELVKTIDVPVYFLMGKYDGMTSPKIAEKYLNNLDVKEEKQMVIFEDSAHYPQFEEKEKFYKWMCYTFLK